MNDALKKYIQIYETEGYSAVIKAYKEITNDFHELDDWELVALKIYMAKLAVINKDMDLVKSLIILDGNKEAKEDKSYSVCPYYQKSYDSTRKCKYLEKFNGRPWCSNKGDWCNIRSLTND